MKNHVPVSQVEAPFSLASSTAFCSWTGKCRCRGKAKRAHSLFIGYGPVCESGKQLRSQGEVKGISSGVAKLGHTGARTLATRGCAPPLLKIIGAECTVINRANWALKVHKGVEIELRSIAICTFRITRSRMLP